MFKVGKLVKDVDTRMVGKRVMFFTPFSRQLEQTVNLPGEGGRGQSSQGLEGRGENQKKRSHARV
jgi:hypothetical protein